MIQPLTKLKNMKSLLIPVVILFNMSFTYAQTVVCLGDDATVCAGSPVTINDCNPGLPAGGNGSTLLTAPTQIFLTDDVWSGVLNIGFTFSFYGTNYNQVLIGSNGLLSFNIASANGGCAWSIAGLGTLPNAGFAAARNTAMLCYQDMNPGVGGSIYYQTVGTAPNRRFIALYQNVVQFGNPNQCNYMSVILHETSNQVEYQIANKPLSPGWNGGLAIQATQNNAGSVAHFTPGRNNTQWVAVNDAKMYTPTAPNNTAAYTVSTIPYQLVYIGGSQWSNTLGQNFPYNGGTLTVNAPNGAPVGYFLTASNVSVCAGAAAGSTSDTTWITGVSSSLTAASTPDICSSGIGTVTANPTGGSAPYTFNWPALGSTNQTVNGVNAGTYTVQMVDAMGCASSANVTVGNTPAVFTQTSTLVSCPGGNDGTATATMTPALGTVSYLWNDPAAQTSQTATGLSAGSYQCTISSTVGCSNTVTATVTEIPGMISNFTTQSDVTCNSDNDGVLTVTTTAGTAPYTYSWDNSSSTTATANDLLVGTHTVTITDNRGCVITRTATLAEPPALAITFLNPDTQICPENDILLTVTGTGGSSPHTFTWNQGNTIIGTGTSITVDPEVTNTVYTVTLSEDCGSPIDQRSVNIYFPTPIVPNLTPNKVEDCVVGEFEFVNSSTNGAEIATTYLDFGDSKSTIEVGNDSTSHDYEFVGTYSIYIAATSIYGCVYEDTLKDILKVVPNPIAHFFFSDNPASVFETTVKAYDKSTGNVVAWEWTSPGSSPAASNSQNPTLVFPEDIEGQYPVTLVVTSIHGCTDTLTHLFTVVDDLLFYSPNTFSPNGDEHNQTWKLYIKGADESNFEVFIFNRWGEMIWESHDINVGWDGTYNGKVAPTGTYSWRATVKNMNDDGRKSFNGHINLVK